MTRYWCTWFFYSRNHHHWVFEVWITVHSTGWCLILWWFISFISDLDYLFTSGDILIMAILDNRDSVVLLTWSRGCYVTATIVVIVALSTVRSGNIHCSVCTDLDELNCTFLHTAVCLVWRRGAVSWINHLLVTLPFVDNNLWDIETTFSREYFDDHCFIIFFNFELVYPILASGWNYFFHYN